MTVSPRQKFLGIWILIFLGVLAAVLFFNAAVLQHWLSHFSGTESPTGKNYNPVFYNWWSGPGSDLGEATLVTTALAMFYGAMRKINCHDPGCWRIGHYPLEGTPHHLCAVHHPEFENGKVTHEGIMRRHEAAKKKREASSA